MLTLEENGWNFQAIKIYSTLNILPLKIESTGKYGKGGKIQRHLSQIRVFLWGLLICFAILHCLFVIGRLIQLTFLEPEKYFRWDHFIFHVPQTLSYPLTYYMGFCLFRKNPGECVLVFNQFFVQRENPVQKMIAQEEEQEMERKRKCEAKVKLVVVVKSQVEVGMNLEPTAASVSPHQKQDLDSNIRKKFVSSSDSGSGVCLHSRPLLTWPPQYSLDEILARTISLLVESTKYFVLLVFAVDLKRPQHLYSFLPPEHQNLYSFLGLLTVEAVFLTTVFVFASFSTLSQLLFFSKCGAEFKEMQLQIRNLKEKFQGCPIGTGIGNRDIRREIWILRQILKEMKELVLLIELFNRCFPFCIFAFKLICLCISVLFYFFTIRHYQDFPFLSVFTGYVAVVMTLLYGILYQKAFSIPEKMEELKNEFLLSVHKSTSNPDNANRSFGAEMKREMEGIRDVGVKVGSFHTMERESTPNFIDFVVNQVVSLLVTFPR